MQVHTAHVTFLDFAAHNLPRPVYFATMRNPLSRLVSHYSECHPCPHTRDPSCPPSPLPSATGDGCGCDRLAGWLAGRVTDYYHFGPRPVYVQLMHQDTSAPTFEDCVDAHMAGYSANRSTFDCMQVHVLHRCCVPPHTLTCRLPSQTIGLQVRFFCGITEACRRESSWTLAKAKENLRERFIAVVVVEKMRRVQAGGRARREE